MFTTASAPRASASCSMRWVARAPGLVHHVGVGFQFAAHQGLKGLGDVAADVLALDGGAFYQAQGFQFPAGNVVDVYQKHRENSFLDGASEGSGLLAGFQLFHRLVVDPEGAGAGPRR